MGQRGSGSQTISALVRMRDLILNGEFKAGDHVSDHLLVERLGVSRSPIRSALQKLEAEGLLRPSPSGGYQINSFSIREVEDAIEVRATLEGMAARSAAERGVRRADMDEMKACLAKLDVVVATPGFSMQDLADYGKLNQRFHSLFVHFSANQVLQSTLARILALPFVAPSEFVFVQSGLAAYHETVVLGQKQHREIAKAIEKGDAARAESVARQHGEITKRNLRAALGDPKVLERIPGGSLIQEPSFGYLT